MTRRKPTNLSASVRQRLLNHARATGRPFNDVLQYFALERFLYRLTKSSHANEFILKGAMMLRARNAPDTRPTMDIDLLGKQFNEPEQLLDCVRQTIRAPVEDDGVLFLPETLSAEPITIDARYSGARIRFKGELDSARIAMQIDIGFGDPVYPAPERLTLSPILDFPAPRLLCYSLESAIAEKFEAALKLGGLTSRIKDLYDIQLLASRFEFSGPNLAEALRRTLNARDTDIEFPIEIFDLEFRRAKSTAWAALVKRIADADAPQDVGDVLELLERFLLPIAEALSDGKPPPQRWVPPGPWD